ncbi:tRNA dihydrouridine(20/20a) synthase DusA [Cardiobacteriales bacterium ML27]|uniref:tRNA-dihydrouridine(20/20a) synthase n=2 Tax=Ostreibacterium oceani TaxID=2654998 RepID=A0A6N7EVQ8_9GAMM|nr:tRNA dihydrouridine(20/20a) synthase DusA [Ostreibacterium oceani]
MPVTEKKPANSPYANPNASFSVAPMMAWTTRHCRYFHRQLTKKALLYTEMVTTGAIIHGDHARFLQYHPAEHPIALQIGGGNPSDIGQAVRIANQYGYDEINLNVGCPSDRVQKGKIGAILMAEPELVAACFHAMRDNTDAKVTIKHRLAIDDMPEDSVFHFVETVAKAGCKTFIIHARKAFLQGLDPKANRHAPPLNYELVYAVKSRFPELEIIINGGIDTLTEARDHLSRVDGVMMGRSAYQKPWVLAGVDDLLGADHRPPSRRAVIEAMLPYIRDEIAAGNHLKHIARHWMGLFHGIRGSKAFKQTLNDHMNTRNEIAVVEAALAKIEE